MTNIKNLIVLHPIISFLSFTCFISLGAFYFIATIPSASSPEKITGFPFWLIAVWSPSLSAIIIKSLSGELKPFIKQAFRIESISLWWLLSLIPVFIGSFVLIWEVFQGTEIQWSQFKIQYLIPLFIMNLLLGPLGEELGWRGFLGPILETRFGLIGSGFTVGIIWALWHGPLWFVNSPQKEIPFLVFTMNVLCFAIIMACLYKLSNGNLIPIVLFHLFINVVSGFIDILAVYSNHGDFYIKWLPGNVLTALILIVYVWYTPFLNSPHLNMIE